jgi:DNA transformation protein and related proteins
VSLSEADTAFAIELFDGLGAISTRKMMGGLCLYSDGAIFGILDREGRIYLRSKSGLAGELAASGSEQFGGMGYWSLPDAALDDPDMACDLARRALEEAED